MINSKILNIWSVLKATIYLSLNLSNKYVFGILELILTVSIGDWLYQGYLAYPIKREVC